MAATAELIQRGTVAPDFTLPGTDGQLWTRDAIVDTRGLLVMFICNHCPYVQAVADRMVRDARELQDLGIGVVAISSNDVIAYPQDSLDNMRAFAQRHAFPFPYLYDESQEVARDYGAVCTPEFMGFNADLQLEYHGRLDACGKQPAPPGARREMFDAMKLIAATGRGPTEQHLSVGCSIKWRS